MFEVNGRGPNDFGAWENMLRTNLNPKVVAIVCIVPG
jgi:hypothetical protein